MSTLFYVLAQASNVILNLLNLLVILSVAMSWFRPDPDNKYVHWIESVTEPLYRPIRSVVGHYTHPIDIAPMLVMFVIVALHRALPTYLMALSYQYQ